MRAPGPVKFSKKFTVNDYVVEIRSTTDVGCSEIAAIETTDPEKSPLESVQLIGGFISENDDSRDARINEWKTFIGGVMANGQSPMSEKWNPDDLDIDEDGEDSGDSNNVSDSQTPNLRIPTTLPNRPEKPGIKTVVSGHVDYSQLRREMYSKPQGEPNRDDQKVALSPPGAFSNVVPRSMQRDRPNPVGLVMTKADNCFNLNDWKGGVCCIQGNAGCPYLGGNQSECELYKPKPERPELKNGRPVDPETGNAASPNIRKIDVAYERGSIGRVAGERPRR